MKEETPRRREKVFEWWEVQGYAYTVVPVYSTRKAALEFKRWAGGGSRVVKVTRYRLTKEGR